jgi:ubiquinone/menaquinone biosynthesis C-methylase UbiE
MFGRKEAAKTKENFRSHIVKTHFSRTSECWDSLYNYSGGQKTFTKYELRRRKEIIFDFVAKRNSEAIKTVLDLGCGSGQYLTRLSRMGFDCYGADISEEMLKIAREKLAASSTVKWFHSDCRNVPVTDHFFDLILCVGVLEYLADDMPALKEIRRLINSDGFVILTWPNLYKLRNLLNPYYYLVRIWTYLFKEKFPQGCSCAQSKQNIKLDYGISTATRYNLYKVKNLVATSGFRVVEVRSCCFGPFSLWKKEILPLSTSIKISRFLERLLRRKAFGFLSFFANRWVVLITPENVG